MELSSARKALLLRNKWASCSTAGNLNFNVELLLLDRDIVDYVIVHELLHLFVPNHGSLWKSLMRAHLGSYEERETKLRKVTHKKLLQLPSESRITRG